MRRLLAVGALLGAMVTTAPPGPAAAAATQECGSAPACIGAQGADFTGVATDVVAGRPGGSVPGTGPGVGGRGPGGGPPRRVVQRRIAPACSGNSPTEDGNLCTGAVSICRAPGDVGYWVWTRVVDPAAPPVEGGWARMGTPPFVCYSPDAPGLAVMASVAGLVQRDFGRYPLPLARVVSEPAGATLVRLQGNVYTTTAGDFAFTVTLLGQQVNITAHPRHWTWHFGDGQVQRTLTPGRAGSLDIPHAYTRPGPVGLSVDVEWSGTYRLPGGPEEIPVRGTATTAGPATPLDVRTARSQYEAG